MSAYDGTENEQGQAFDRRLLLRLWPFVRPYRRWLVLAFVLLIPVSLVHALQPYLIKVAIDDVIAPVSGARGDLGTLVVITIGFLGALALETAMRYAHLYALQAAGQLALHDLRVALFAHIQKLSPAFFDRTPVGRILTRLTGDVEALQEMFASGIVTIVGDLVTLVFLMGMLLSLDARLAGITFLTLPILVVVVLVIQRVLRDAYRAIRVRLARINSYLNEHLSGMPTIQSFGQEPAVLAAFKRVNGSHRDAHRKAIAGDSALYSLVELLASVTVAVVLWIGAGGVDAGAPTLGVLVLFVDTIQKFFAPIRDLSAKYTIMQSAMSGAERIFRLFDTKPDVVEPGAPVAIPGPRANVPVAEFRDVTFRYARGEHVLRGVNLVVDEGERVAVVGLTGAGKTSLLALLKRFYDIESGSVRVRGVDVRDVSFTELRRLIVGVEQEPVLFAGTLGFNLDLGDKSISAAAAEGALAAVQASRLIEKLRASEPARPHAPPVLERGANLSVGEKQLITLARALLREPALVLLDEATSHVDPETEARVQEATKTLLTGRAAMVVAHRLSTVRYVDRVVVLHHGEKVEEGTHAGLLAQGGAYAKLYELQFAARDKNFST